MTVEHLLRHQGGFHYRGADVMFTGYHPDPEEFVRQELRRPLAFTPGTWQQYSNFGYFLLSLVIEKASGMPYDEFMQKEVFQDSGELPQRQASRGIHVFHAAGFRASHLL